MLVVCQHWPWELEPRRMASLPYPSHSHQIQEAPPAGGEALENLLEAPQPAKGSKTGLE